MCMVEPMEDRLSKAKWLTEGLRTLAHQGAGAVKVGPMASALGVSRGSFYWHFSDIGDFRAQLLQNWRERATDQVIAARERLAARRSQAEERIRHFHEQLRRHRALHDGPLRVLTAIAGQGPAGHPDPRVRRQAAISANVLRGATPDDPDGTLTELSLALIEAGNEIATQGLRVEYHFANLPDTLPAEVLHAFRHATGEALANVARHAGISRVRLTALTDRRPAPTVTVAVVDQGQGFDPDTTALGYGIRHSITARMHEVGGTAGVDSHPGQGTRVDLRWPA